MAIQREEIKKWLVNYQHALLIARYEDVEGGDALTNLFSNYMYPPYEKRNEYRRRNEFFKKIIGSYATGRIRRVLGGAIVLFSPLIGMARRMKELPAYLQMVVDLYELTNELDERMVDALSEMVKTADGLNAENYEAAYRKCTTYEEREKQIKSLVALGEYARDIVEHGGMMDFLIENCPRVPLLTRNRYVEGINQAVILVQTTYRAFKSCKGQLNCFRDICLERECKYLNSILKPAPDQQVSPCKSC